MRLQLTAATLLALVGVARAQPADEPAAGAIVRIYADDDHVTVISPRVTADVALGVATTLALELGVDAVTAASVDVMTSASPAVVHERRVDAATTVRRAIDLGSATSLSLGGQLSHESDYDAARVGAGARTELAQRNTTLEVGYVVGLDVAGARVDPAFRRTRTSQQLLATASQLLGTRTVADLTVDLGWARGYHASPYRRVALEVPGWPLPTLVDEQTPARRASVAVQPRLRRALGRAWFANATYRLYLDDWSMTSHTLTTELLHRHGDRWLLGVVARGYLQDGADFYRASYAGDGAIPRARTRDRTLGPMQSLYVSARADRELDAEWHVVFALGVMGSWFAEFPAQAERRALLSSISVAVPL